MYLQINPQIVSAEGGEETGFVDFIWDLCIPHMERNSTEKKNKKQTWANKSVGLIVSETLMYTTAVLQSKSIQTFLLPPPPLSPPLSPLPFLSHSFCLIDVSDGEAGIPAFCSFREELGGGQGVTLGKVTDERAAEEGGGEVALKRVGG